MPTNLGEYDVLAHRRVDDHVYTNIFQRDVLLAILGGSAQGNNRDRPDGMQLLGSARSGLSDHQKALLAGTPSIDLPLQTTTQGGGKKPGYRGVSPSIERSDTITDSLRFMWTNFSMPVYVWQDDELLSKGEDAIVDIALHNIDSAMNDLADLINASLIAGYPTSQTEKVWDDLIGVVPALDGGATYPTYGGLNKNSITMIKPALFSSTATNFSFGLIDAMNREVTLYGDPVNLVLANHQLFYNTIQPKARAEGLVVVEPYSDIPEFGVIGFRFPAVRCGSALIVPDRSIPAGADGSSKSHLVGLNTKEWMVEVDPRKDFAFSGFKDQSHRPGGDRAWYGTIDARIRFYCKRPWLQALYTNVN